MRLCIDLKSGEVLRKVPAKHDISSPILANGKVLAYEINGSFLSSVEANPEKLGDEKSLNSMPLNAHRLLWWELNY